jgi:hypothetical protein
MSFPIVYIEFQTNSNDDSTWNTMKIERIDFRKYRVTFRNATTNNNEVVEHYFNSMVPYLKHFLKSITFDESRNDRINNIQFDVPCFASNIVSVDSLLKYIPVFIDQLAILDSNWPVKYKISSATPAPPPTEAEFDTEDDDDDEDEDEDEESDTESIEYTREYLRHGRIGHEYD